jgi:hypothetical protein
MATKFRSPDGETINERCIAFDQTEMMQRVAHQRVATASVHFRPSTITDSTHGVVRNVVEGLETEPQTVDQTQSCLTWPAGMGTLNGVSSRCQTIAGRFSSLIMSSSYVVFAVSGFKLKTPKCGVQDTQQLPTHNTPHLQVLRIGGVGEWYRVRVHATIVWCGRPDARTPWQSDAVRRIPPAWRP